MHSVTWTKAKGVAQVGRTEALKSVCGRGGLETGRPILPAQASPRRSQGQGTRCSQDSRPDTETGPLGSFPLARIPEDPTGKVLGWTGEWGHKEIRALPFTTEVIICPMLTQAWWQSQPQTPAAVRIQGHWVSCRTEYPRGGPMTQSCSDRQQPCAWSQRPPQVGTALRLASLLQPCAEQSY